MSYEWILDGNVISGPLIVCVAGSWREGSSFCQPLNIARELMMSSGSNLFVVAIPPLKLTQADTQNSLSLEDLFPDANLLKSTVFFINTYHAENAQDAFERVKCAPESLGSGKRLLVKLEVFDEDLKPDVNETIEAIHLIKSKRNCGVVPIIPSNVDVARKMASLEISGIRVLTGDIGKGTGIIDPTTFEKICDIFQSHNIPVIAEGGMSSPSHIRQALLLGATAVLCNSCFKVSEQPLGLLTELLSTGYDVVKRP